MKQFKRLATTMSLCSLLMTACSPQQSQEIPKSQPARVVFASNEFYEAPSKEQSYESSVTEPEVTFETGSYSLVRTTRSDRPVQRTLRAPPQEQSYSSSSSQLDSFPTVLDTVRREREFIPKFQPQDVRPQSYSLVQRTRDATKTVSQSVPNRIRETDFIRNTNNVIVVKGLPDSIIDRGVIDYSVISQIRDHSDISAVEGTQVQFGSTSQKIPYIGGITRELTLADGERIPYRIHNNIVRFDF